MTNYHPVPALTPSATLTPFSELAVTRPLIGWSGLLVYHPESVSSNPPDFTLGPSP